MERGRIVKALSGFYYVDSGNGTLTQCRACGRFPQGADVAARRGTGSAFPAPAHRAWSRRSSRAATAFIRPAVSNLDALVGWRPARIP